MLLPEVMLRCRIPNYCSISRKHIFFLHLHLAMKEIFFLPHAKSITAIHVFLHIVLFLGFEMSPNGGQCKLVGTVLQWVLKPELVPSESK